VLRSFMNGWLPTLPLPRSEKGEPCNSAKSILRGNRKGEKREREKKKAQEGS
jgi:hypothetical protein